MAKEEEALVLGPDGRLVQRELGVDVGVENYNTYEEAVDALIEQKDAMERTVIEVNWNIGRQAFLLSQGAKYGDHKLEDLAKDLDMSLSSLYTNRTLYTKYTLDDVRRFCEANISYRKVTFLMACNDEYEREKIREALEENRIGEEPLKLMVSNANEGIVMPEDPQGLQAYVDMCKAGNKPEAPEEDDEEEEEEEEAPSDPIEKFRANLQTSCDELSLVLSDFTRKVDGIVNVLNGEIWGGFDDKIKESFKGILTGTAQQLSLTLRKGFALQRKLPTPDTKEADK